MPLFCRCCAGLSRRHLLALAGASAAAGLPGCAAYNKLAASTVSPEQEAMLGAQAFQQIKGETPRLRSPQAQARVQRIAERIVPASGSSIPLSDWEIVVFDSDEVNAFALPGGHIGVYRGILEIADSDDEIATVMGHEVGHVTARHAAQRIGTSQFAEIGTALFGAGAQAYGLPTQVIGLLGAGIQYGVILPYTRNQELEADSLGLRYMAQAAYNPEAAVKFWQAMQANAGADGAPAFLSTHPSGDQRIAQIEAMLPEVMPLYQQATS